MAEARRIVPFLPVLHGSFDDGRLCGTLALPPEEVVRNIDEWARAHPDVAAMKSGDRTFGEIFAEIRAACVRKLEDKGGQAP